MELTIIKQSRIHFKGQFYHKILMKNSIVTALFAQTMPVTMTLKPVHQLMIFLWPAGQVISSRL